MYFGVCFFAVYILGSCILFYFFVFVHLFTTLASLCSCLCCLRLVFILYPCSYFFASFCFSVTFSFACQPIICTAVIYHLMLPVLFFSWCRFPLISSSGSLSFSLQIHAKKKKKISGFCGAFNKCMEHMTQRKSK